MSKIIKKRIRIEQKDDWSDRCISCRRFNHNNSTCEYYMKSKVIKDPRKTTCDLWRYAY